MVRDGVQMPRCPRASWCPATCSCWRRATRSRADARLVSAVTLKVSEASLTGESEPVLKDSSTLVEPAALGDRLDMVFNGTAVTQGIGRAVVTATGMDTQMGTIADLLHATHEDPTPLQREISHVGRMLGIAVVVIALVVTGAVFAFFTVDSVADVVDCAPPRGLARGRRRARRACRPILSVVLALGVQRMAAPPRHRQEALVGGDAGLGLGDLLRQDRHPDQARDDDRAGRDRIGRGHASPASATRPEGGSSTTAWTLTRAARCSQEAACRAERRQPGQQRRAAQRRTASG